MKKLLLFAAILAMGTSMAQADVTINLNKFSNTDHASPGADGAYPVTGWISTDGGSTTNGSAVYDVSTFIADNVAPPQPLTYTVTGLDIDGVGGENDQIVVSFTISGVGGNLQTVWDSGAGVPKNAGWISAGGNTLDADGEYVQFDFASLSVDLNGGTDNGSGTFDGFSEIGIGAFTVAGEVAVANGLTVALDDGLGKTIDLTGGGLDSNLQVIYDTAQGSVGGGYRPEAWSFQVTINIVPVPPNEFTDESADGMWATSANWVSNTPSASLEAIVNSNLTANLSGGAGNAKFLKVGTIEDQSGTVNNGSLTVVDATQIGTAPNATGIVDLTDITAGNTNAVVMIGTASGASGSLTTTSGGSIIGSSLSVGTDTGANGTLDLGTGSTLDFEDTVTIGGATSATGLVTVSTFTLTGGVDLTVGGGANAKGTLIGGASSVIDSAILRIGSSSNAWGLVNVGTGSVTSGTDVRMASGQDSLATLEADTLTLSGSADLEMAQADGGDATLTVTTLAIDDGDLLLATGVDSTVTLNVTDPIVLDSTNGLFVGTGAGSSHNLSEGNFSVSGPIGNIGFGEGSGSEIDELINLNDSYGSLTINDAFTFSGGTHQIMALTINDVLTKSGGTVSLLPSNTVSVASIQGANASVDMADWGTGEIAVGAVNVARAAQAVGSLSYTAGTLLVTAGAGMEVGTGGDGSEATVLLKSLAGGQTLSICNTGTAPTGTVTVTENAIVGTCRVGRGQDSVATLTVGGMLEIRGPYLNASGLSSNAVATITADTLIKTNNTAGSLQIAQGADTDGRIMADSGEVMANALQVAPANGSVGLFALTNGTLTIKTLTIASGADSAGTVLVAITSSETNNVNIGTGSNAVGVLTQTGGELWAANLTLGGDGTGAGSITLAGGDLVVAGALSTANASNINITDNDSSFAWAGKTSADFEALWAVGTLSFNGESGLTGASFGEYFLVTGDVLGKTPVGIIAIANGMGGVDVSWDSLDGTSYNVETNGNLVIPGGWGIQSSVVGDGGTMTVTVPDAGDETFFRVVAP